jgi:LacI family transcriptional regulator
LKRITIKDIARELKLHHSTVSRALRNDNSVKFETREKVMEYAKNNGYQINLSALQLRGTKKNVIAVLVPNINHNFFSNIVSIITNLAYNNGYVVSVFQSNEKYLQEKQIIETLIQNNVAGVIASVSMETVDSEHLKQLKNYKIPLVLFDRICLDIDVPKVTVNNFEIVEEAVEILIKQGYKKIAHISGTNRLNVFRDRQSGYLSALKNHNLNYIRTFIIDSDFNIEEGKKATGILFQEMIKPDALICDSHLLTLGAIFKIRELNLSIPEDIGMVGFSDNPYIEVTCSEIISIVQPDEAIAKAAFEMMMKQIEQDGDKTIENIKFPAKIIERQPNLSKSFAAQLYTNL